MNESDVLLDVVSIVGLSSPLYTVYRRLMSLIDVTWLHLRPSKLKWRLGSNGEVGSPYLGVF